MFEGELSQEIPENRFALLSREELISLAQAERKRLRELQQEKEFWEDLAAELAEELLLVMDQYIHVKNKVFRRSSERSPKQGDSSKPPRDPRDRKPKIQLPSERYPDALLIEREVTLKDLPNCQLL